MSLILGWIFEADGAGSIEFEAISHDLGMLDLRNKPAIQVAQSCIFGGPLFVRKYGSVSARFTAEKDLVAPLLLHGLAHDPPGIIEVGLPKTVRPGEAEIGPLQI